MITSNVSMFSAQWHFSSTYIHSTFGTIIILCTITKLNQCSGGQISESNRHFPLLTTATQRFAATCTNLRFLRQMRSSSNRISIAQIESNLKSHTLKSNCQHAKNRDLNRIAIRFRPPLDSTHRSDVRRTRKPNILQV